MQSAQSTNIVPVESSRVIIVVGAELAVQSQQHRTRVHDTHNCSQQVGIELNTLLPKSNFN